MIQRQKINVIFIKHEQGGIYTVKFVGTKFEMTLEMKANEVDELKVKELYNVEIKGQDEGIANIDS